MIPTLVALVLQAFLTWAPGGQVYAALTNTTIDDTDLQHWSYGTLQQGAWTSITAQTPCANCSAQPDPTQVHNQSWHDGYRTTGAFAFQGSAVYIYGIDWFDDSNVTFAMENPSLTGFHYWRGGGYVYNVLFFSATGLDPTVQHIVTWVNTPGVADNGSMLFDYAVVTVDQPQSSSASGSSTSLSSISQSSSTSSPSSTSDVPPPSHKSKSKTGTIVGAIVGVVGALALLGAAFMFWRRRQSSGQPSVSNDFHDKIYAAPPAGGGRTDAMGYTVEPYQPHPNANRPFIPGSAPSESQSFTPPVSSNSPAPMSAMHSATTASGPSVPGSSSNSKRPPVVMEWDPHQTDAHVPGHVQDPQLEERLRNLEELLVSRPPAYK